MRYLEMNAVRANLVEYPAEYCWSSYAANAQGTKDPIVTPHPLYLALGSSAETRQEAYRALFRQHMSQPLLREIRQALTHERVPGCGYSKDRIEVAMNRQARLGQPGRPRSKNTQPEK